MVAVLESKVEVPRNDRVGMGLGFQGRCNGVSDLLGASGFAVKRQMATKHVQGESTSSDQSKTCESASNQRLPLNLRKLLLPFLILFWV